MSTRDQAAPDHSLQPPGDDARFASAGTQLQDNIFVEELNLAEIALAAGCGLDRCITVELHDDKGSIRDEEPRGQYTRACLEQ